MQNIDIEKISLFSHFIENRLTSSTNKYEITLYKGCISMITHI